MSEDKTDNLKDEKKIKFDYIKSNFFRVIHADGVLLPSASFKMSIFL